MDQRGRWEIAIPWFAHDLQWIVSFHSLNLWKHLNSDWQKQSAQENWKVFYYQEVDLKPLHQAC